MTVRTALVLVVLAAGLAACKESVDAPKPAPGAASAPAAAPAVKHEMKETKASAGYPLTKCVVSGEDLAAMGDRVAYTYDGVEVQFCCPDCVGTFEKDPEKYLAQIRAAGK